MMSEAWASRSGSRSITITRSAPLRIAARAAIWPTPPAPQTATTSPGRTPIWSALVQPVLAASDANSAVMSSTSSGIANAPIACEYPKQPPGEYPHMASVMAGLGLPLSHSENSFCSQYQHRPHAMKELTTTRSPALWLRTDGPTSATSPMNSWPRTSPARIVGMYPPSRCRSEPHVVESLTLTMMSSALRICGSGTVSTSSLLIPVQHSAFISRHPFRAGAPRAGIEQLPAGGGRPPSGGPRVHPQDLTDLDQR